MNTNDTHLILGFTGGIGRAVALALNKRNIPVRALVRDKSKAQKYAEGLDKLTQMEGDASDIEDLDKAFDGVSVAYYCINIPYDRWEKEAMALLSKSIDAAIKHKAKLIFPGNVYVYGCAQYNPVDEKHPHAAHTKKGQIRIEMEEMLTLSGKERNLAYSIIRMPDFYGPFVINTFSEQVYINAIKGKKLQWIGDLDVETELIFIEDGGVAMVMTALDANGNGEVYNIPGSAITTARNYLDEIEQLTQSKSKIGTLNSNLVFKAVGFFNPMVKEVMEMLYLKREKLILDGTKFKDKIGSLPSTNYKTGISNTLEWAKKFYGL